MTSSGVDRFAQLVDGEPNRDEAFDDDAFEVFEAFDPGEASTNGYNYSQDDCDETSDLLTLVSALRTMDFDISPSPVNQRITRQRLVAMAAVRTSELAEADPGRHRVQFGNQSKPVGRWQELMARLQRAAAGRRLIAGVATLSVLVAAMGVLALMAQNALPGETLYAVKRGTEQARLVLASNDQAEGRVLLGLASTRLQELDQLLDEPLPVDASGAGLQAAAPASDLLISTMDTMDSQTAAGTRALTTAAMDEDSLPILQFVGEWGIDHFAKLDTLADLMPQDALDRAEVSKDLLQRVVERLEVLAQAIDCESVELTADDLGPSPRRDCAASDESTSPSASSPNNRSSGTGVPTTSNPATSTAPATTTAPSSTETSTAAPAPPEPSQPQLPEPGPGQLPLPLPIPIPNPIPTQSSPEQPPTAPDPDDPPAAEGEPCVLIGLLGIRIPGIVIGDRCVGLGG